MKKRRQQRQPALRDFAGWILLITMIAAFLLSLAAAGALSAAMGGG